jgi:hypothetical protein
MSEISASVRKSRRVALAIALALSAVSASHAGSVIQFDPNGTAGANALGVLQFDEAPGNVLAVTSLRPGGNGGLVDGPFRILYQAKMSTLRDADNDVVAVPGLTTPGELTIVALFNEVGNQVNANTATFSTDTDQTGSFVRIYYDTARNANDLAGTGFADGTLIYEGLVQRANGGGSFTQTGTLGAFDQAGTNNYPGVRSVIGAGGSNLVTTTSFQNSNFFVTDIANAAFTFNTSNETPFRAVNPSRRFFDGTASNIGAINGRTGPDFQFQSDATSSFELVAVPEPASLAMAGLAVAATIGIRLKSRGD